MMVFDEKDDPDENTVLVDSFRAGFERWTRPAYKQAAQRNRPKTPVAEHPRLKTSYKTTSVGLPDASGSTVNAHDTTTHLERALQPLSLHGPVPSTTESDSQPSSQSDQGALGQCDEAKSDRESTDPECPDEANHRSSVKSQNGQNESIPSNETVNGDNAMLPIPSVTASNRRLQLPPSPMTTEKTMKAEDASPELQAELKAIRDSVRNGKWWVKRAAERRRIGCGPVDSNPEVMKYKRKQSGVNVTSHYEKNYIVEENAAPKTNYMEKFPEGMSDKQRHEMEYTVYRDSVHAYPRYKRGKCLLASTTKIDAPAYEKVPPTPSPERMFKILVMKRNRRQGEKETSVADWGCCWDECEEQRFEITKRFWSWLDDTIIEGWFADIYHEPFFDGTAHADGMHGFYISPDLLNDAEPAKKCELKASRKVEKPFRHYPSPGDDY